MNEKVEALFNKYIELCKTDDPVACGDLVYNEDDETCKALFEKLRVHPETKDKLVKPLWFNYITQKMRWEQ